MQVSQFVLCLNRKGKKKLPVEELVIEKKLYLDEQYLNHFLKEKSFIKELVPLPPDIEMNEWLATHSKYIEFVYTLGAGGVGGI